jgi:hypothetical protein
MALPPGYPKPLTRAGLDLQATCDDPSCRSLHGFDLVARCHPSYPLTCTYHPDVGAIVVQCAHCDSLVVAVEVAP